MIPQAYRIGTGPWMMDVRIGTGPWLMDVPSPMPPGSPASTDTKTIVLPPELQAYYDAIVIRDKKRQTAG